MAGKRDGRGGGESPLLRRRRVQTWLFSLALAVLVLGTVAGVVLAWARAVEAVEEEAQQAAASGAALLEIDLREVAAGLSGASAIIGAGGELDVDVFLAYARDPLAGSEAREISLIDIVEPAERAAFEARVGAPIVMVEDGGRVSPAPEAMLHAPVVAVEPDLPGRGFVGFDIRTDPARLAVLEAAEQSRSAAVGAVVDLAGDGSTVILVIRPLIDASGDLRGFIATGVPAARVQETIETPAGRDAPVALFLGDVRVSGDEMVGAGDVAAAPVDLPQGDWRVVVGRADGPELALAWLVGAGGGVAILTMVVLIFVTERHQRRLARANADLRANEVRSRAVQDVAGRLARALGGSDVAAALIDHLPAAVGARSAVVATVHRSGRLEVVDRDAGSDATPSGTGSPPEPRFLPVPAVGSVLEGVLATREAAWLSSPLGWRGDEAAAALAGEGNALAVLPLLANDVSGVLAVSYPHSTSSRRTSRPCCRPSACSPPGPSPAAGSYDAEHQAAVAFQRAALPDALPEVHGASVAARYRPATHGATVGGDWYDVLALDADRVLLVVGDVVGHGMVAAAAMGRLRTAFQTIVPFSADPGSMLQAIGQQVAVIPDAFCTTVVAAVLDLGTGESAVVARRAPPAPRRRRRRAGPARRAVPAAARDLGRRARTGAPARARARRRGGALHRRPRGAAHRIARPGVPSARLGRGAADGPRTRRAHRRPGGGAGPARGPDRRPGRARRALRRALRRLLSRSAGPAGSPTGRC